MNDQGATEKRRTGFVRHEHDLHVGREQKDSGAIRIRTTVDGHTVSETIGRDVEHAIIDREPAAEDDPGGIEELEDGSLSIPILEEELVVTKRVVVRERIIVRKVRRTEPQRVEAELHRERVDVSRTPPTGS